MGSFCLMPRESFFSFTRQILSSWLHNDNDRELLAQPSLGENVAGETPFPHLFPLPGGIGGPAVFQPSLPRTARTSGFLRTLERQ